MKNFSIIRYIVPVWILTVFVIILFAQNAEPETHTRSFCAYGSVFVEFEEGNHKWGTMLLNRNGKPIPCQEPTGAPVFSQEKENII